MIELHNTLSRKKDSFTPLKSRQVRLYTCGPTVYDNITIGNLRAFIAADILRRVLIDSGYRVKHVMNLTDVDDKTIKRSGERYPDIQPLDRLKKLTDEYTAVFMADMQAIGNDIKAITFTSATGHIEDMQALIRELLEEGIAYTTDDGIYFSIAAYEKAGKKYGQLLDISYDNTSNSRIDNDEYDKDAAKDFALWKVRKPNEPAWEFIVDGADLSGRPGWHIECSAMSVSKLGQPFDIHTGGIDLIFPHHENEIAQSTATKDDVYARYFVHNEHLLVDKEKMSKSLNNFYTLLDLTTREYDPLDFRFFMLQSHYRTRANFTWKGLNAARNRRKALQAVADIRFQTAAESIDTSSLESILHDVRGHLADDMNTPRALAALSALDGLAEDLSETRASDPKFFTEFLSTLDNLLGLRLCLSKDISTNEKKLLIKRQEARSQKNWTESDALRDTIAAEGIGIRDTMVGQVWYRL